MDFFFADVPYGKGDSFKSANEMVGCLTRNTGSLDILLKILDLS